MISTSKALSADFLLSPRPNGFNVQQDFPLGRLRRFAHVLDLCGYLIALPEKPAVMKKKRKKKAFYLVCVLWVAKNRDSLGSLKLEKLQEALNGARPAWSFSP